MLVIIKFLLFIATIVVFAILGIKENERSYRVFRFNSKQMAAIIPLALFVGVNFLTVIPANNVGIIYSPFSGVKNSTLSEGLAIKGPVDKVYTISTEVQTTTLKDITAQTKDSQWLNVEVDVKYRVDSNKAFEVFKLFRTLDNVDSQLIPTATQRAIESVMTNYNIIEALGEKRNEIYTRIEEELTKRFSEAGITFFSITFIDTDAGDRIENAITAEAVAKKEVETARQQKAKIEIEAQAELEKAKIEAETKLVQAQAEADANKLIAQSITQGLIDKLEAEARLKHGWVEVYGGTAIVDTRD